MPKYFDLCKGKKLTDIFIFTSDGSSTKIGKFKLFNAVLWGSITHLQDEIKMRNFFCRFSLFLH